MNRLIALFAHNKISNIRSFNRLTADGKEIKKVKSFESRITLISPDNSVTITDIKNAQNMSVRRDLKLVKIQDEDTKTRRPIYKLMTSTEYHHEELQKRKEKQEARNNSSKGEKLLTLSTRIGDNDLLTGIKKMMKLLEKQYEVRVVIAGDGKEETQKSESMFSTIEKQIASLGKVVQKRNKGNSLRFQLLPLKEKSLSGDDNSKSTGNQDGHDKGPL